LQISATTDSLSVVLRFLFNLTLFPRVHFFWMRRYVHDISDIFIDLLKMANFLKLDGPRGAFISELAYVSAVVSWLYYRMYQYPFRVMHAAFVFSYRIAAVVPRLDDGFLELFPTDVPFWQPTNLLLLVLQLLHIYWFYLLFMVGYRILTESTRQASRAEYEGDSDDDGTPSGPGRPLAVAGKEE
jgi:hypothetical protein